ncbi:MAG: IS1595 family transposase, partial [Rhizobiales bacterium]|nr:IS1595 family transposase [Hyphomicrobiales bacterium]
MSILTKKHFHDEAAAFAELEAILWPDGPVCPHCGGMDRIYSLKGVRSKPSKKHPEGVERHGLKKCGHCRKQFTVRVGTVFEDSHAPLHKWFQAIHLLCSSKKGISSHQLHRILEVQYNTAWFMSHRIREAMRSGPLAPMGGSGGIVEADETYIGKTIFPKRRGNWHLNTVVTLVERGGNARSFHVERSDARSVLPVVNENIAKEARVMTDGSPIYKTLYRSHEHESVNHKAGEYVRGDVHTNTVEGYFSIFKRGM